MTDSTPVNERFFNKWKTEKSYRDGVVEKVSKSMACADYNEKLFVIMEHQQQIFAVFSSSIISNMYDTCRKNEK